METAESIESKVSKIMEDAGMSMTCTRINRRSPNPLWEDAQWDKDAGHWRIRCIDGSGREIETEYSQGSGHRVWSPKVLIKHWKGQFATKPTPGGPINPIRSTVWAVEQIEKYAEFPQPTHAAVMSCLVLDSDACTMSFDDWCNEYGHNSDSISQREAWIQLNKQGYVLRSMFGQYWDTLVDTLQHY